MEALILKVTDNEELMVPASTTLGSEIWLRFPLDLGLHAAEDEGRTEDATEQTKRKARDEEGRVFLTAELPQALELLLGATVVAVLAVYYYNTMKGLLLNYLENPRAFYFSEANMKPMIWELTVIFLKLFLPVGIVSILSVTLATMLQTGFHFSAKKITNLNFSKFLPTLENLRNKTILSKTHLFTTLKNILKVLILGVITYLYISFHLKDFVQFISATPMTALIKTSWMIYEMIAIFSVLLLAIAIPDYFVQRAEFEESLKLTKQQLKQEYKESEGDPEIKARQFKRARELASRRMLTDVRKADVVITNPDHYAVALVYDVDEMRAPKVLAKGVDDLAQRIKAIAKENNVPLVENRPLARGLYASCEVGDEIPLDLFGAVAEILGALDKFKNMGRANA